MKNGVSVSKCNMYPSKEKFNKLKNKPNKSFCDLMYLNKFSFGSQGTNYAVSQAKKKSKETGISYQKAHKDDYKNKMKNTTILNQDFKKVMKQYDSKETFHYLDPPYVVGGEAYGKEFNKVTPKEVCNTAKSMKGKVLISYDNHPEVRKACKGLKIKKVPMTYSLNNLAHHHKNTSELLISNYKI